MLPPTIVFCSVTSHSRVCMYKAAGKIASCNILCTYFLSFGPMGCENNRTPHPFFLILQENVLAKKAYQTLPKMWLFYTWKAAETQPCWFWSPPTSDVRASAQTEQQARQRAEDWLLPCLLAHATHPHTPALLLLLVLLQNLKGFSAAVPNTSATCCHTPPGATCTGLLCRSTKYCLRVLCESEGSLSVRAHSSSRASPTADAVTQHPKTAAEKKKVFATNPTRNTPAVHGLQQSLAARNSSILSHRLTSLRPSLPPQSTRQKQQQTTTNTRVIE